MFIYLIVNHITGKYYVGQHKGNNLKKYLQDKFSRAKTYAGSSHLFNSMRKHPKKAWSIHALLSDVQTRPELDAYEKDFISFLRSQDPEYGYNICRGGEGFTGPHSDKTRQKMSITHFGRKKSPEAIVKSALARRGLKRSPETVAKIRCATEHIHDMKGMTVDGIEVLERAGTAKNRHMTWLCRCACGKIFVVEGSNLRNGHTKSCGCLRKRIRTWVGCKIEQWVREGNWLTQKTGAVVATDGVTN